MKNRGLWSSYIFIAPNLLFVSLFMIYPLFHTFYLSFFKADLFSSSFVGWSNYVELSESSLFWKSFINTFYYVLIIVPSTVIASLGLAALMQHMHSRSKAFFRLVFYLPVVSTPVVLSLIWVWMLNPSYGIVSYFLSLIGADRYEVLSYPTSALISISVIVLTYVIGKPLILYLSAMDGVSKEMYESAEIDGANQIQQFFKITLPLVIYATTLIVITTTISIFQIFVVIFIVTSGGPMHSTESLVFTIYKTAFQSLEFGLASAQSVILFFIILLISLVQFRLIKSR